MYQRLENKYLWDEHYNMFVQLEDAVNMKEERDYLMLLMDSTGQLTKTRIACTHQLYFGLYILHN